MKTFQLTDRVSTTVISEWLEINNMFEKMTFDWVTGEVVFEDDEDAVAFSLKFPIRPVETILDKMIKNEESHD